jgi:8-oxo-dGTP diphosphatase
MKKITLTVDPIIITKDRKVVLVRRKFYPFKDYWVIPGGKLEHGEILEHACVREAKEETGLKVKITKLVGVYSDPRRDPRGHYVSVAFLCKPIGGRIRKKTRETKEVRKFSPEEVKRLKLGFDHRKILKDSRFLA